jgi:drug/metabolite transporter (DMT)-like permease
MFNALSTTYKAIVLALIGFTSYSVADTSSKLLSAHYSVYQIIAGVALVILILCVLLAGKMGGWQKTFATNKRRIHLARGITNSIISVFLILALSKLPLATVYSILFTSPFIATLMAIPVFKERVSFHGWVSIIGGFIGVLLVFRPGVIAFDPDLIWALMSAGFIAVMFMLSRALKNEETALSLAFFPAGANFLFRAYCTGAYSALLAVWFRGFWRHARYCNGVSNGQDLYRLSVPLLANHLGFAGGLFHIW